jgi:putative transcriptional regulator
VPVLAPFARQEEPVYLGGPVQPGSVVVLAEFDRPEHAGLLVTGSIGFLIGEVDEEVAAAVRRARVFSGYAGWGPGQLEEELAEESWIVEPALPADLFAPDPEALWAAILRRKGGDFALMATMPFDPSLN